MANVIEIAKASITAYNDKDWSKAKDMLAADAVYDEKGTNRRIQTRREPTVASKALARSSRRGRVGARPSLTRRPHSCASSRAGTLPSSRSFGRAFTPDRCRHRQAPFRHRTSRSRYRHAKSSRSRAVRSRASRTTSICSRCSHRSAPRLALQHEPARESRPIRLKKKGLEARRFTPAGWRKIDLLMVNAKDAERSREAALRLGMAKQRAHSH